MSERPIWRGTLLTDEEFDNARVESSRTLAAARFVPAAGACLVPEDDVHAVPRDGPKQGRPTESEAAPRRKRA